MPHGPSAFSQLLKPLDRRALKRIVTAHDGDHGVGSGANAWTCVRHLKAMVFAQLAGLNSLREIEQGLAAHPGGLYHLDLRPARRSTLCDAQSHRPAAVFRDICMSLMAQASRTIRREAAELVQLVDASPIPLRDRRYDWAQADLRVRGLKLHLGYDPRNQLPDWLDITSPKVSDITAAHSLPIRRGATYVMDKGYLDYGWWHRIHEADAFFVTRLKKNSRRRAVKGLRPAGEGILADNRVKVGHPRPRGGKVNPLAETPLREIVVARPGKEPLCLVTNDLTRSAADIAALYKERWQIELMFKWLKQTLKIKRFVGRSENAVKIQIYCAIIAFLLLRMFRNGQARAFTPKALLDRIKVALFSKFDCSRRITSTPRQPRQLPTDPQFQLKLNCS